MAISATGSGAGRQFAILTFRIEASRSAHAIHLVLFKQTSLTDCVSMLTACNSCDRSAAAGTSGGDTSGGSRSGSGVGPLGLAIKSATDCGGGAGGGGAARAGRRVGVVFCGTRVGSRARFMAGGPKDARLCDGNRLVSAALKRVAAVESAEGFQ